MMCTKERKIMTPASEGQASEVDNATTAFVVALCKVSQADLLRVALQ